MAQTFIRGLARTLSPDRPIVFLAQLANCRRATAKSWATGHRRPPLVILQRLRDVVRDRVIDRTWLLELDYIIRKRKDEPKHRTGFWIIDPATGQNRANRLGRPKRNRPATYSL
jgi:hypothetical protein